MNTTPIPWVTTPEDEWSGGTWNIDKPDGTAIASTWPGDGEDAKAEAALSAAKGE